MAVQKKFALGRGLDALISTEEVKTAGSSSINEIELSKISVNPNQPRREFDPVALQELADSIAEIGIIQPITLRQLSEDSYQIIAGERRYRASIQAGLKSIPAYIRTADDENVMEMALIENIQREDLNSLEIALAYQHLLEQYALTQERLSEKKPNRKILDGKVVATLFFEPSTRTRLSFETAANRLGARVIGFTDPKVTSSSKGETLKDTIMMVSNYADIIVMRHFLEGAARYASEVAPVPIVNAGDGANQHPSQTMLDLYSIYKTQGTLENLNIYLVGDLKYGRTVHSLLMAMRHFNPTFHFIAPEELKMPEEYKIYCKEHHIKYKEYTDFNEETIADADILYMTRVQRERFTDLMEYERVKDVYILRNKMLEHTRPNLRILHPLPRVNEIAYDVDENPKAYYFQQAQNGLYARQAILCDVLGITLNDVIEDAKK